MICAEERLQILRESPPNTWVALSSDECRVVGRGGTYSEVIAAAEQSGEEDPLVIRVPEQWIPMVL